jgi:hypothetical protein
MSLNPSGQNPMLIVPRKVWVAAEDPEGNHQMVHKPLSDFRDLSAWVLLGEPGSGKSTSLQEEAEQVGAEYLHIDDFLDLGPDPKWAGKTLFLDGLDEVRTCSRNSALHDVRKMLRELGHPRFRIACRAHDWYGSTDTGDLARVSPDQQISTLILEPLSIEEIREVLRINHGIEDPEAFLEAVKTSGLLDLLGNPQTMEMVVKARRDGSIPNSVHQTLARACEILVEEVNPKYHQAQRTDPRSQEQILDAAGWICSVILLANLHGVSQTREGRNQRFASLEQFPPPDLVASERALSSRLFRNHGADRLVPTHRTIAEFLGARWLARRIDQGQLSLRRLLNLLVGMDRRSVHGLRGLYAWLANLCLAAQSELIRLDSLTVLVYGDPKSLSSGGKLALWGGLLQEAESNPGFSWDSRSGRFFGGLACSEITPGLREVLESSLRSDSQETKVSCALDVMNHGEGIQGLNQILFTVVEDPTHWKANRKDALRLWLKWNEEPGLATSLLKRIQEGRLDDEDDEFLGILLGHLYPAHIGPSALLECIHIPKNPHLFGAYRWFVEHELPPRVPTTHLPDLLDGFARMGHTRRWDYTEHGIYNLAESLLLRGLVEQGESIPPSKIFEWLGIGEDIHWYSDVATKDGRAVGSWLEGHPDQFIGVMTVLNEKCRHAKEPVQAFHLGLQRFRGAQRPRNLGLWHLQQVARESDERLVRMHLAEAVQSLWRTESPQDLTIDDLFAWAGSRPERRALLDPLLCWEIPSWRQEHETRRRERENEAKEKRAECHQHLRAELAKIRDGTAPTGLLFQLSGVWLGHYLNTTGETPEERFRGYCEPSAEVHCAAEVGFRLCLNRTDIPTAEQILDLHFEKETYHLQNPCLIGAGLQWERDRDELLRLPRETLRSLVAFRILELSGDHPEWFKALCVMEADLVAEVFITRVLAGWAKEETEIFVLQWLQPNELFIQNAAPIVVSALLEVFPKNPTPAQIRHLESLLKAAVTSNPSEIPKNCRKRLPEFSDRGASDHAVLWLLSEMAANSKEDPNPLWEVLGDSLDRLDMAAHFVSWLCNQENGGWELSPRLLGGLVERLSPYASRSEILDGPGTAEQSRRDLSRGFINLLGVFETPEAGDELERLAGLKGLCTFSFQLKQVWAQQRVRQREAAFRFLRPARVAQVLSGSIPACVEDLTQLTLDHLDQITSDLRTSNDDGFRAFWNVVKRKPVGQREENLCRDQLLLRLRVLFTPIRVECAPEFDYANDKRADIRVSYQTEFAVPIEVKRDSHVELWTSIRNQLVPQYTRDPLAQGYGIFLVLWFGEDGTRPDPTDGQRPTSIEDLQSRLEAQLLPGEEQKVFVRVVDVSWPR